MPAAIDHYQALGLLWQRTDWHREGSQAELGKRSQPIPILFPAQPFYNISDIGGGVDGDYSFVIRAVYADGSWSQNGCSFHPRGTFNFRTRHKTFA